MTSVVRPTHGTLSEAGPAPEFAPFRHPAWLAPAPRLILDSGWLQHIPFGMYLVEALHPRVLVELGTHSGCSYSAFCQAIKDRKLSTQAYAVDNWKGDPNTGFYGPEILDDFRRFHDSRYAAFSSLMQTTFDEASTRFADDSIDLLHIDGYHSYDAVRHDFETWRPKLSRRGVVLIHDTQVRSEGFGVWPFWEELRERHPSFELIHGNGLGVLAVGPEQPSSLRALTQASSETVASIRSYFFLLGHRVSLEASESNLLSDNRNLRAQLESARAESAASARKTDELERLVGLVRGQLTREQRNLRGRAEESVSDELIRLRARLGDLESSFTFKLAARAWRAKDAALERVPSGKRLYERLQKLLRSRL